MTIYVLDILPALAIIALIVSFVVKRRGMKREETELRETLQELQAGIEPAPDHGAGDGAEQG